MLFTRKPVAKIVAKLSDNSSTITIDGITAAADLTVESTVAEVNKVLGIVGTEITSTGIKRVITEEVSNNG